MEIDTMTQEKYYQWIKGDNAGTIETWIDGSVDFDGEITFLTFKSGRQINAELIPEFMTELNDPREPVVDEDFMNLPKSQPIKKAVAPKIEKKEAPAQQNQNPVFALLDKSIKTDSVQTIRVNLNLPAKDLIKVVASSFENGQDTVLDYLVSQIPVQDLQNQIKEQLRVSLFAEKTSRKRND
jgi:hypothetical protein